MQFPWEKVIPHKPQMLETARGWYDKWVRGERVKTSANDAAEPVDDFADGRNQVNAYAEPVKIEDVVEVKETTRDVSSRLEALEFAGMAQAETIKNLTDQSQNFSARLASLDSEVDALDQQLEEARSDARSHRSAMEELESRMQQLSSEASKLRSRANMAVWIAVISVLGAAAAIGAAYLR